MPSLSHRLLRLGGQGRRGLERRPNKHRHLRKPSVEQLEARNLLTFYGGYRTVDELYADLATIANTYSDITDLVNYGQSYSKTVKGVTTPGGEFLPGYDLLALHITNKSIPGPKPVFFLSSGMHAREISTPEVTFRYISWLTQGYGNDADATWLVDQEDIWVAPMVNPDGHWYVELGTLPPYSGLPWYWRKNGHPNSCTRWPGSDGNSYGVDLNRNFDDHWGTIGSSPDPCSEIYRGPAVNSEPESLAYQDLVRSLIPAPAKGDPDHGVPAPDDTTGILIDIHTFGGYVLWPWGHTPTAPPNSAGLTAIGNKFATYNRYRAGQSFQTLYPTSGIAPAFAYGKLGIPAYTFELNSNGFLDTYSSVDGHLWPENRGALIYAAKIARTPYITVHGPDALQVTAGVDSSVLYVTGRIDDRQNGNQNIVAAEFYVDVPPWADGAKPYAMEASDGDFDSPLEDVDGLRSTEGLDPGRHIVYVRGLEATGNWGPVSAAFFDLAAASVPHGRTSVVASLLGRIEAGSGSPIERAMVDPVLADETRLSPERAQTFLEPILAVEPSFGHTGEDANLSRAGSTNLPHELLDQIFAPDFLVSTANADQFDS